MLLRVWVSFYGYGFNVGVIFLGCIEYSYFGVFGLGVVVNFVVLFFEDLVIIVLINVGFIGVLEMLIVEFMDLV